MQSVGLTETDDREVTGVGGMELCPLGQILLHQWNEDSEEENEEAEDKFQELLAKRVSQYTKCSCVYYSSSSEEGKQVHKVFMCLL